MCLSWRDIIIAKQYVSIFRGLEIVDLKTAAIRIKSEELF